MLHCRIQETTANNLTVASNRGKAGLFGRVGVILRMRNTNSLTQDGYKLPRNYSITVIAHRISAYLQLEIHAYTTHRTLVEHFIAA